MGGAQCTRGARAFRRLNNCDTICRCASLLRIVPSFLPYEHWRWHSDCLDKPMSNEREIIPDAFRTVASRTATGSIIVRQYGDAGDQVVIIPPDYVRAFVEGIYRVASGDID